MDQAPEQEMDVHRGIENTLTMLKFRLKHGVEVKREFDTTIPRIFARGSELNQVWANLIDNAIDAISGKGQLIIRTSRELDFVLVEIIDSGAGILGAAQSHIFGTILHYQRRRRWDGHGSRYCLQDRARPSRRSLFRIPAWPDQFSGAIAPEGRLAGLCLSKTPCRAQHVTHSRMLGLCSAKK
jgi:light-regulated signal transduction histidine kinase (bacteriophytochrome)